MTARTGTDTTRDRTNRSHQPPVQTIQSLTKNRDVFSFGEILRERVTSPSQHHESQDVRLDSRSCLGWLRTTTTYRLTILFIFMVKVAKS